jgi:hypothetical protein
MDNQIGIRGAGPFGGAALSPSFLATARLRDERVT